MRTKLDPLFVRHDLAKGDFKDTKLGIVGKVVSLDPPTVAYSHIGLGLRTATLTLRNSTSEFEEKVLPKFMADLKGFRWLGNDLGPDTMRFKVEDFTLVAAGPIGIHASYKGKHDAVLYLTKFNIEV